MICAVMTEAFLALTLSRGNDLTTPYPEFGFPGLKPGDRWCVCIDRWVEARNFGVAPPVDLRATHHSVLASVPLADLKVHTPLGGRIVRSTIAANGFARPS
jgi:uncharacterized protein (DUF2237 family)